MAAVPTSCHGPSAGSPPRDLALTVAIRDRGADVPDRIDETAAMLAAFTQAVAPLMTPLVAQLVDQAETIGRLRAEAAFLRAQMSRGPGTV